MKRRALNELQVIYKEELEVVEPSSISLQLSSTTGDDQSTEDTLKEDVSALEQDVKRWTRILATDIECIEECVIWLVGSTGQSLVTLGCCCLFPSPAIEQAFCQEIICEEPATFTLVLQAAASRQWAAVYPVVNMEDVLLDLLKLDNRDAFSAYSLLSTFAFVQSTSITGNNKHSRSSLKPMFLFQVMHYRRPSPLEQYWLHYMVVGMGWQLSQAGLCGTASSLVATP